MEAALRHGHGSEAVPPAQNNGKIRHRDMGADHKHSTDMADLGALLDLRSHHESRCIAQGEYRETMGIAKLHESGGLVRAFSFNGSGHVHAVIGHKAERPAFDAYQSCNDSRAKFGPQLEK